MVRLSVTLVDELDKWAKEDEVSRNTLVGRELATAVNRRTRAGLP